MSIAKVAIPEPEHDLADWDSCDTHEHVFPKGDECGFCCAEDAYERAQGDKS